MKTTFALIQRGKGFSFLMMLLFACSIALAQTPTTTYLVVTLLKVAPENQAEYEKLVADTWKPVQQLRKQNGKIINWALFKVHFKGDNDEYNYASATYYDSYAKTQENDNWTELLKAVNPKTDAAAAIAKLRKLRTSVRQGVYVKVESVSGKTPTPFKFGMIGYMKSKPGMANQSLKLETDDWKPIHQVMVDAGQMLGWNVWNMVLPGGTVSDHDYFTSNLFSSYEQTNSMPAYEAAFKKTGKDLQATIERISKTTDLTKRELLELVVGLN